MSKKQYREGYFDLIDYRYGRKEIVLWIGLILLGLVFSYSIIFSGWKVFLGVLLVIIGSIRIAYRIYYRHGYCLGYDLGFIDGDRYAMKIHLLSFQNQALSGEEKKELKSNLQSQIGESII